MKPKQAILSDAYCRRHTIASKVCSIAFLSLATATLVFVVWELKRHPSALLLEFQTVIFGFLLLGIVSANRGYQVKETHALMKRLSGEGDRRSQNIMLEGNPKGASASRIPSA